MNGISRSGGPFFVYLKYIIFEVVMVTMNEGWIN